MPDRTFTIKIRDYQPGYEPDRLKASRVERVVQRLLDRDGSDGVVIVQETKPEPEHAGNGADVKRYVADVEAALNSGALVAGRAGWESVRQAFVSTRSYLREQLGEGSS